MCGNLQISTQPGLPAVALAFGSVTGAGATTVETFTKGRAVGRNMGSALEAMTLAQPDQGGWGHDAKDGRNNSEMWN